MKQKFDEIESKRDLRRNTTIGFVVGMMLGGLIDVYTGDLGVATILGMVLGSLIGYYGLQRMHLMEYPRAALLRLIAAGVFFFGTLFATFYVLEHFAAQGYADYLPFVPVLPGLFLILSMGYALSSLDELQRRIQVEAIAIGFGITALITLTYGLMGMSGAPEPSWMWIPVIMTFAWLIGKLWTRWKYR